MTPGWTKAIVSRRGLHSFDPGVAARDRDIMREILSRFQETERQAVFRFYRDRAAEDVIENDLGWRTGQLRELRRLMLTAFLERRKLPPAVGVPAVRAPEADAGDMVS